MQRRPFGESRHALLERLGDEEQAAVDEQLKVPLIILSPEQQQIADKVLASRGGKHGGHGRA